LFCNLQINPYHPIKLCQRLKSERVLDGGISHDLKEKQSKVIHFRENTEQNEQKKN
jgi:hypothetical protein